MKARTLLHPPLVLAALAISCALLRLKTYAEPLDGDISGYAVIAHGVLQGKKLYDDLWDHKPPAIHVSFVIAEWIAGYGEQSIYLLNVAASVVTLLGVYQAGRALAASGAGGLFAAGLWTIVSMEPTSQANQPNTEVFINACQAWVLALLLRHAAGTIPLGSAVLLGCIATLATLYKPVAFVPATLAGIAYVCRERAGWIERFVRMLVCGGVSLLGWLVVAGYFVVQGRGEAFFECVFGFNAVYVPSIGPTIWESFEPRTVGFLVVALLPAVVALCLTAAAPPSRARWLVFVAFAFGTHCAVAMPGFFHAHYYQFWLPVLCVAFAGFWGLLVDLPGPTSRPMATAACAGLLLVVAVPYIRYFSMWDADQWSAHKFKGECIAMKGAGLEVRKLLKTGETMFEWGDHMGLYFYGRQEPITRLFFVHPLFVAASSPKPRGQEMANKLLAQMTRQIVDAPPDLFVIPRANGAMLHAQVDTLPKDSLLGFLMREYEPVPGMNPNSFFLFLARPRSDLMRRLAAGQASGGDSPSAQP